MKFTKMHGLGNDYVYVDGIHQDLGDLSQLARRVSDRHFGIGSDGLICICPSDTADFRMRMFNADGSEGMMCGNGIRCMGKFVYDKGLTSKRSLTVETLAGERKLFLNVSGGKVSVVTVDMGIPVVQAPISIFVNGNTYIGIPVSMGNPHCVVEVANPASLDLEAIGPSFERWPYFPDRTNTEFVQVVSSDILSMRVWERGSGETMACGTGACAAVVAMSASGRCGRKAGVHLLGGELFIEWEVASGHVFMTGPAVSVFDGELSD